ncbi:MAG: DsbC family protein [Rhodanobacter sp.]
MRNPLLSWATVALVFALPLAVHAAVKASDADVVQVAEAALHQISPDSKIASDRPSALPGFREIVAAGQVVYVSNDGRFVIQGQVFDLKTSSDLSAAAETGMREQVLSEVSPADELVFAPPHPKYTVIVFTDPTCGYCRELHTHINEYLAKGIAIHYLPFPRSGADSEVGKQTAAIWCAKDPKDALSKAFAGGQVSPAGDSVCDPKVKAGVDLGLRLGVLGTPSVFTSNGVLIGGLLSPDKMEARIKQALNL